MFAQAGHVEGTRAAEIRSRCEHVGDAGLTAGRDGAGEGLGSHEGDVGENSE